MGTHPIFESDFDCLTEKMLDSICKYILALGGLTVSALIIAGEFIELSPELKPISSLSKLSKYFLCLIAAFNCAWLHLGNYFAGQNTPAGAFHSLSRVISLSVGFSACLDFLQKTKSTDQNQIIAIKFVAFVMFISLACSVRMLLSLKVARQVQLKCGDPISQTLLINGLIEFIVAISLLTYPSSVPSIMASAYKIKNIDLLMIRVFASLSIGLALMNFATLGLSEDDATKFLSVRKLQYVNIMTIFLILHYFDYFSPIHTFVVFGTILQFVFILLPKVKEEMGVKED